MENFDIENIKSIKTEITNKDLISGLSFETFLNLLAELLRSKTLIVSYKIDNLLSFIKEFLKEKKYCDILNYIDILDIEDIYKNNNENYKRTSLKSILKYYNIDTQFEKQSNITNYYLILKEMMKINNINCFIQNHQGDIII